jgi:hypothetical protein
VQCSTAADSFPLGALSGGRAAVEAAGLGGAGFFLLIEVRGNSVGRIWPTKVKQIPPAPIDAHRS